CGLLLVPKLHVFCSWWKRQEICLTINWIFHNRVIFWIFRRKFFCFYVSFGHFEYIYTWRSWFILMACFLGSCGKRQEKSNIEEALP
ncbi:unnamed protein product, partial [Hymenolepis diminuta]